MLTKTFVVILGLLKVVYSRTAPTSTSSNISEAGHFMSSTQVTLSATYSETGWMLLHIFDTNTCGAVRSMSGSAVNVCLAGRIKMQLVENSCKGAVKQTFKDNDCTILTKTEPAELSTECNVDTENLNTGWRHVCTTDATLPMPYYGAVLMNYKDNTCTTPASFFSFSPRMCTANNKAYSCNGEIATQMSFTEENCMGTMTTEEFTTGCAGSNFPLYFPGGQTTCMGTGGASANFLLDARVIAGLVVVGIALLSL